MPQIAPLLAADFGGLIAIVFLLLSFIGWISNLVSGQQKGQRPQPQQRPKRQQDKRIRDEIDAFLKEAGGERRRPAPQRRDEVLRAEDVAVEAKPAPRRPQPVRQPPPRPQLTGGTGGAPSRPAPAPAPSPLRRPLGEEVSQRHVGSTTLGEEVSHRHVGSTNLGAEVPAHVRQHIPDPNTILGREAARPPVKDSVFQNLGDPALARLANRGAPPVTQRAPAPAAELLRILKQKEGVRQAFILTEVLRPPKALQR